VVLFWEHSGNNLGAFWDYSGIILGMFWQHSGIILGIVWQYSVLGFRFLLGGLRWSFGFAACMLACSYNSTQWTSGTSSQWPMQSVNQTILSLYCSVAQSSDPKSIDKTTSQSVFNSSSCFDVLLLMCLDCCVLLPEVFLRGGTVSTAFCTKRKAL